MNSVLVILSLILCGVIITIVPGMQGATALLVCISLSALVALVIFQNKTDKVFLMRLFVGALLARLLIGIIINMFQLQDFFGGDANTYDFYGDLMLQSWGGNNYYANALKMYTIEGSGGGWGMLYMVASVYKVVGRNVLAIQFVNAVLGAAAAPAIFVIAQHIFGNLRVSRIAALFVAFFPSLVLWSAQALKDGPIIFMLAVSMLATLKLGEKFSLKYLLVLIAMLIGLISFRFYIFYMVLAAVIGSFAIGMRAVTAQSVVRQFVVVALIGLALTYFGITRLASKQIETFGNLETVQRSRLDQAQTGKSGFEKDVDVSTTSGALSAIPLGVVYLLFAPFPWQLSSLRQLITLPEMLIWWSAFPLLVTGLWFTIKHRLRQISPILLFTAMLTLAYSVFQGNVGTAYRQRAQLLIFYFIFVAVGVVLSLEKREEKKRLGLIKREAMTSKQAAIAFARRSASNN